MDPMIVDTDHASALGENESAFYREQLGDGWTRFVIRHARGPRPMAAAWLCLAAFPWFVFLQLPHNREVLPFFLIISGVIVLLFIVRFVRLTGWSAKRQPGGGFDVGPLGVRLRNGTVLARGSIARVLYRNALSGQGPAGVFAAGHGAMGAAVIAGAAQQQRDYQAFVPIAYRVEVEHSGRSFYLAGGLTEASAYALYVQVTAAMALTDYRPQ